MFGFLSKLLGGNKSEKDVKKIQPYVTQINQYYQQYASLSNDELRNKTVEFRTRINDHVKGIDETISERRAAAEALPAEQLIEKDSIFQEVDKLIKEKDKQIEDVLLQILPEAFATIKEASRRLSQNEVLESTATELDKKLVAEGRENLSIVGDKVFHKNNWVAAGNIVKWNMVHYDVQLIGGTVLHQGKIAEMATGEGKTLVSTLPAYLNALPGLGAHIVTVNDYLAKRDSEWNGPLFEFLGLTVDCIDKHQPNSPQRRNAYKCDIVYGTNNEFGFDYLRDNMTQTPDAMVQRKLHYAMIDEVDSVLIDDARTPLIISGPIPRGDEHEFYQLKPRIERLVNAQIGRAHV